MRVVVRSCQAYRRDGVGTVADPVRVGVGVQWVRSRVRAVDVCPGIGLDRVLEPIAVVVRVGLVADPVAVGVQPLGRVEGEGVGACLADPCDRYRPVAVPVAVSVRVERVGSWVGGCLGSVVDTVAVVVLILDQRRVGGGWSGQLVRHAITVGVFAGGWVEGEGVQGVIDAIAVGVGAHPHSWVEGEGVQVVIDAIAVVVRVGLVADPVAVGVQPLGRVEGEGVGACLADPCDRYRPVAVPVAVSVRVERVGSWVGGCLGSVVDTVAVVVLILDQRRVGGGWSGQLVRHAITVGVFAGGWVQREGVVHVRDSVHVGIAMGEPDYCPVDLVVNHSGDRVARVARLDRRRAADGARAAVHAQSVWK